ncbi:alpha/beta fold hydrolase [Halalkalibacter sp. APA_J-10(15)]|uniref:alpha/beta hydrolase n=1 Tax=Halalkalibacter sp. APA_J-10(15) TaxID=2933805 RepID=UPI0027E4173C|nr:alpha/beta fold hydrolase [Halalkalibacter sp. APA_J-10(15)]
MMRTVAPQPFTFTGDGERAVLLLHGFTGTTADVRMLGRFLQKKGYTSHAPLYRGHGKEPQLLLQARPSEWWEDVKAGYHYLHELGYEKIAVAGLSLGGLFSLKLAYSYPVVGVIPMCTPMKLRAERAIYEGLRDYVSHYKRKEQVAIDIERFRRESMDILVALQEEMIQVKQSLEEIHAPAMIIQARHDEMIDINSATIIHQRIASEEKEVKWYEDSTHVITLGKERDQLHEDIGHFLDQLHWS